MSASSVTERDGNCGTSSRNGRAWRGGPSGSPVRPRAADGRQRDRCAKRMSQAMSRSARAADAAERRPDRRLSRRRRRLRRAGRRASGAVKPHWEPLLQALAALDPATRALRMEQLNARVRETGIAHDLFSDPASAAQPWRIDLVPLIIAARGMARARARPDPARAAVRGHPRRPLRPAAAAGVRRHPASARVQRSLLSCGPATTCGRPAASSSSSPPISRAGPDGRWRVIDTHTETPAGIGYALANRMVHTNVAGDIFARLQGAAAGAVLPAAAGRAGAPRQPRRSRPSPC